MGRATFYDRDAQEYTALRLEHATERGRLTIDGWYGHRAYFIPPSDTAGTLLQDITGEDAARLVIGGELERHGMRIAVGAYGEVLSQQMDNFSDYTLMKRVNHQNLLSGRVGGAAHLDRPYAFRSVTGLLSARLSVDGEGAFIRLTGMPGIYGFSSYGELALGARLAWRWLSFDGSVGALLPFDNPSATWPEAKLIAAFKPHRILNLLLIGARKGRVPTLREQYDPVQGNAHLRPEQAWHGELQLQARPHALIAARLSGYVRRDDGLIRIDPTMGGGMGNMNARNVNLGVIFIRGFETGVDVARERIIGGGVTYVFEDAHSPTLGNNPIANFPRHRVDAYLSTTFWRRRMGGMLRYRWSAARQLQGQTLAPYYVMDLYAWARVTDRIRASLRIDNLTNNGYLLLPGLRALGTRATLTVEGVWE
jgi:hypothetical protein